MAPLNWLGGGGGTKTLEQDVDLSAGGTVAGFFPAGCIVGVVGRVTAAIVGPSSINIGTEDDSALFHVGVGVALNSEVAAATAQHATPVIFTEAKDLVVTPVGGAIVSGTLHLQVKYFLLDATASV